ncbi:MAG: hypothetical protein AB8B99_07070 [Phormidesmis sp.]
MISLLEAFTKLLLLVDLSAALPDLLLDWLPDWPFALADDEVFFAAEDVAAVFLRVLVLLSVPFSLLVLMALILLSC